jgi:uncharacterized protein DUF262/uncharacterized protein DUF1524
MKSDTLTVQQVFQDRRQYRVPFYQRPYVWNREDQWDRLWSDIEDKAEARLQGDGASPHFMGAVVLEPQPRKGLIGVERLHIIDGQQRLTTLQYVLTSLAHALRERSHSGLEPLIEGCLVNSNPQTMEDKEIERFKVWPTFRDRKPYVSAMTALTEDELRERFPESFRQNGKLRKIGIAHPAAVEAIWYFWSQIAEWVDRGSVPERATRAEAIATAILCDLSLVCISLGEEDDAQVIFETLNGHGAQLNATDLIRNFIFMRAGYDADELYSNLWSQFESEFWSEKQTRGRLKGPRLEWFVQTTLHAESGEEVEFGRLYTAYRRFAGAGTSALSAAKQLQVLDNYAEHYKGLITGVGESPIAALGRRMAPWDASTIHPIARRIASSSLSTEVQLAIFGDIESYFVRRAICGLTTKNYNKVFAQLLKKMLPEGIGLEEFRKALAEPTGDATRWPRDDEFRRGWTDGNAYPGRLDASKLRAIFHRLETVMRSERTEEAVPLTLDALDIDHILPQSWYRYWRLADGQAVSEEDARKALLSQFAETPPSARSTAILDRETHIPRMGNLTLLHYGVNRPLQNREFSKKREALFQHSNLQLNRHLMLRVDWDEAAIRARGETLFQFAKAIWPFTG